MHQEFFSTITKPKHSPLFERRPLSKHRACKSIVKGLYGIEYVGDAHDS